MTTTQQGAPAPHTPHTPLARTTLLGIGLAAVVTLIVMAFLWPSFTASPKGLPIAIAGPSQQTTALESALKTASPHTFKFVAVFDRADAVTLIKERKVYGGIVLGDSPEVLTASAANLSIAQELAGFAPSIQAQRVAAATAAGAPASAVGVVKTTDVVKLAKTDPRGSTLAAASFPMVLGGMLGGILIALLVVGVWRRVAALLVYAVVGSLAVTAVLEGWFGALQGNYFINSGAIALGLFSIAGVMLGLASIVGRPGLAVGPVLFLLGANPISAAALPVEFLAKPWGAIGQWFPPGAGATLLRELSYFPKSDLVFPWLVLGGWAALGLLLSVFGHFKNAGAATAGAEAEAEAAVA